MESRPGLALLHSSYSPFWNVVGGHLKGLLGSPVEENNRKQLCKQEKGHLPWTQALFLAHRAFVWCLVFGEV